MSCQSANQRERVREGLPLRFESSNDVASCSGWGVLITEAGASSVLWGQELCAFLAPPSPSIGQLDCGRGLLGGGPASWGSASTASANQVPEWPPRCCVIGWGEKIRDRERDGVCVEVLSNHGYWSCDRQTDCPMVVTQCVYKSVWPNVVVSLYLALRQLLVYLSLSILHLWGIYKYNNE